MPHPTPFLSHRPLGTGGSPHAASCDTLAGRPRRRRMVVRDDVDYLRELVAYWADGFDWPAQEAALAQLPRFQVPSGAEGAFAAMHRSKPQTAAVGLNDSPAGLAAWIVEKLRAWSDCDGDVERRFTKDEILTNVMIYWLTGTIGSSMRMYRANASIPPAQYARRVEVPSGFSIFAGDFMRPPTAWLERTANVVYATEPARGGHFAPFEEPEQYAEELRTFFRPYRTAAS
jgi:pimeloyl-ACP methyl ester carboxylesterase